MTQANQPNVMVRTTGGAALPGFIASRALSAEDEFKPYYTDTTTGAVMALIEPPYNPAQLQQLCSENNTLGPCIDCMETNIDGTGYIIEKDGVHDDKDAGIKKVEEFFAETYPGLSFESVRKAIRRDLEQTGNGYLEVMRNVSGDIVFLRSVPARTVRILRLDDPVVVPKSLTRGGVTVTVPTLVRERRYVQMLGATFTYFREFNSSRQVNYKTGWWDSEAQPCPVLERGTEIIHFKVNDHYYTPYGLPRWEGQMTSVLGSRRAEEYNLTYFETGGLPPVLITVAGGHVTDDAVKSLDTQFNGRQTNKHRAVIMDVQPTGGSLDSSGKVEIDVHSFGGDRQNDGMFQTYDTNCHNRVRRAFRIPPLFVGEVANMNFAVAYTAYLTAENQVFRPERDEFDSVVNTLLMPSIAGEGYTFRSKDLSIADISTRLAGLQVAAATGYVDPKDVIKTVNEAVGLNLEATDKPVAPDTEAQNLPNEPDNGASEPKPKLGVTPGKVKPPEKQGVSKSDYDVLTLADSMMVAMRQRDMGQLKSLFKESDALTEPQQAQLRAALSIRQYLDPTIDPEGMATLAGCTAVAMIRSGALD